MKVTVLGSGSGGNAILLEGGTTRILVDAGFSGRQLEQRLDEVGVHPGDLAGVVVTHEHGDHTRGVGIFARRHGTPVYITDVTREACRALFRGGEDLRGYRATFPFTVGSLRLEPFLTVHDAADPVAMTAVDLETGTRVGIATDLGRPTAQIRHALEGCHLLVLEANHDEVLLRESRYPWSVKERISSSHGHLSNRAAAQLAVELHHPHLVAVVLAHLSTEANCPELARSTVEEALGEVGYRGEILVAAQDMPVGPLDVDGLRRSRGPDQYSIF